MSYGVKYCWGTRSGDSWTGEYTAIFESEEEFVAWFDSFTEQMKERFAIVGEGEISSDLEDTLQFIREEIPDNDPEEEDEEE